MPGSRVSSPRTVGRSRDGEQEQGELPGVYELGRKQTITAVSPLADITDSYHSETQDYSYCQSAAARVIGGQERLFTNIVNTRRCNACPSVCFGKF